MTRWDLYEDMAVGLILALMIAAIITPFSGNFVSTFIWAYAGVITAMVFNELERQGRI